jgi:hypothetical protein
MNHRSGVTLIEVLISIFVTAIGLLALLALFPVGAISMARALKDSRCAQAAHDAASIAGAMGFSGNVSALYAGGGATGLPSLKTISGYSGPSYPVYVDPLQAVASTTVGGALPRTTPTMITNQYQYDTFFTVLNDISFQTNGMANAPTTPVDRTTRYCWTYMFRQPVFNSGVVRTTIVVYSGRSSLILGETAYSVNFVAGTNSVIVDLANNPQNIGKEVPAVRNGSWILDATVVNATNSAKLIPDPHGYFYRVVSVTSPAANAYQLELERPLRPSTTLIPGSPSPTNTLDPATQTPYGVLVVLDNVAEVIEK